MEEGRTGRSATLWIEELLENRVAEKGVEKAEEVDPDGGIENDDELVCRPCWKGLG